MIGYAGLGRNLFASTRTDAFIATYHMGGVLFDERFYGGGDLLDASRSTLEAVAEAPDHGFVVAGEFSDSEWQTQLYVAKFTHNLETEWEARFPEELADYADVEARAVVAAADGGLVASADVDHLPTLVSFDGRGERRWTWIGDGDENAERLLRHPNGDLLLLLRRNGVPWVKRFSAAGGDLGEFSLELPTETGCSAVPSHVGAVGTNSIRFDFIGGDGSDTPDAIYEADQLYPDCVGSWSLDGEFLGTIVRLDSRLNAETAEASVSDGQGVLSVGSRTPNAYRVPRPLPRPWFVQLSKSGELLRQVEVEGADRLLQGSAVAVASSAQGGHLVVGHLDGHAWALRLDGQGEPMWSNMYRPEGSPASWFTAVLGAPGAYLLAGPWVDAEGPKIGVRIVLLDEGGGVQWERRFTGGEYEGLAPWHSPKLHAMEGRFGLSLTVGGPKVFPAGLNLHHQWPLNGATYLLEIAATGELLDSRSLMLEPYVAMPGRPLARTVVRTAFVQDDAWFVAGARYDGPTVVCERLLSACGQDVIVSRLEGDEIRWSRLYGTAVQDNAASAIPTPDGGFVLAATSGGFRYPRTDAWLLKLDASGNARAECLAEREGADTVAQPFVGQGLIPTQSGSSDVSPVPVTLVTSTSDAPRALPLVEGALCRGTIVDDPPTDIADGIADTGSPPDAGGAGGARGSDSGGSGSERDAGVSDNGLPVGPDGAMGGELSPNQNRADPWASSSPVPLALAEIWAGLQVPTTGVRA